MTLAEVRKQFEEGLGTPILTITKRKEDYVVVYVLLRLSPAISFYDAYSLHRYRPFFEGWIGTVDCENQPLDACLALIEIDFREFYPR